MVSVCISSMGVIKISFWVRLNDAGVRRFSQGLKNFKNLRGKWQFFKGEQEKSGGGLGSHGLCYRGCHMIVYPMTF